MISDPLVLNAKNFVKQSVGPSSSSFVCDANTSTFKESLKIQHSDKNGIRRTLIQGTVLDGTNAVAHEQLTVNITLVYPINRVTLSDAEMAALYTRLGTNVLNDSTLMTRLLRAEV